MFHRMGVSALFVALVASATTLSLRAAADPPTLNEVLARAATATAALASPGHRIVCEERARQTLVGDPLPIPLDWSHNPTPWAFRDIVASWSLTISSVPEGDAWEQVRPSGPLGTFEPFPNKRAVDTRITAMADKATGAPAPFPRVAAVLLSARNQSRFEFSKGDETEVDGLPVWEVKFRERATPPPGTVPIDGSVWIEVSTGRVVRSAIAVSGEGAFSDSIAVGYHLDSATRSYLPHRLTRRTYLTDERVGNGAGARGNLRLWVETTGTLTECRVSPTPADGGDGEGHGP